MLTGSRQIRERSLVKLGGKMGRRAILLPSHEISEACQNRGFNSCVRCLTLYDKNTVSLNAKPERANG